MQKLKFLGRSAIAIYVLTLIVLRFTIPLVSKSEFNNAVDWYRKFYTHAAGMGRGYLHLFPSPNWYFQNLPTIFAVYRASDIIIFILLCVRFRVGLCLLMIQTFVLTVLEQMDQRDIYEGIFGGMGEHTMSFIRKIGFMGALLACY